MPLYRILNDQRLLQPFKALVLGSRYQEQDLENWIEKNPQVLLQDEPMLIIGRQVNTPVGIIDLLGLDSSGAGMIIELKRSPNQREVIAQGLEYVAWLSALNLGQIRSIADDYLRRNRTSQTFEEAWQETFGTDADEAKLNKQQRLFIVIEGENERITSVAQFLRGSGVDISLLTYNLYQTASGEEILNFEMAVGSKEDAVTAETRPTEGTILHAWDDAAIEAYTAFKEILVQKGLYLKPQKSGISFIKQTAESSVFVCFFNATGVRVGIWLRSDSLKLLFDFQSVAEKIKEKLPEQVSVKHTPTWFIMSFIATPAVTQKIANILLADVVSKLN